MGSARRVLRWAVGQKVTRAERVEPRIPGLDVKRPFAQRLQDHLVADLGLTSLPSKRQSLGRRTAWLRPCMKSLAEALSLAAFLPLAARGGLAETRTCAEIDRRTRLACAAAHALFPSRAAFLAKFSTVSRSRPSGFGAKVRASADARRSRGFRFRKKPPRPALARACSSSASPSTPCAPGLHSRKSTLVRCFGASTNGAVSEPARCVNAMIKRRCAAAGLDPRRSSTRSRRRGSSSKAGGGITTAHRNTHLSMSLRGRGFAGRALVPRGIWRCGVRD